MTRKNVLLLTTYFPPSNLIAARRSYGLVKYLPENNWNPYVITIKWTNDIDKMGIDPSIEPMVQNRESITRVPYRPNKYYPLFSKLWRWRRVLLFPQTQPYDYFKNTMNLFPEYLEKNKIDAIWATSPYPSPHLLANKLCRKFNIPWVADFRDWWDQKYLGGNKYSLRNMQSIATKLVQNCNVITSVSPALVEKIQNITDKKVICIYNGFDPDEYNSLPECTDHNFFTVVYTGRFILPQRSPASVFSALELLLTNGYIDPNNLKLVFYGSDRNSVTELLKKRTVKQCCEFKPAIPHSQVPAIQKTATILLHLSHPTEKGIMTGKIFEYLAARRPILSVPGDNDCVDNLLNETKAGCSRKSIEDIAGQIKEWYAEWKQTGNVKYYGFSSAIKQYSYPEMARQTAELLDKIIERPRCLI